jgi:hypothetical protein
MGACRCQRRCNHLPEFEGSRGRCRTCRGGAWGRAGRARCAVAGRVDGGSTDDGAAVAGGEEEEGSTVGQRWPKFTEP